MVSRYNLGVTSRIPGSLANRYGISQYKHLAGDLDTDYFGGKALQLVLSEILVPSEAR
jgi:hypothetical protein